jgi:hypothetical protein
LDVQFVAHLPSEQNCPDAQDLPQPPQFAPSDCVSVHAVPHIVRPVWHAQLPAVHSCPVVQAALQAPQFALFVLGSMHALPH